MKRPYIHIVLLASLIALSACGETFKGMGADISKATDSISKATAKKKKN